MRARTRRLVQGLVVLLAAGSAGIVGAPTAAAATGSDVITTVAGTGDEGAPSEGPATSSPLRYPNRVAVAPAGSPFEGHAYFLSDEQVWRLSPTGNLVRFAGGGAEFTDGELARDAALSAFLTDVAVAPDGQVYVSSNAGVMYRIDTLNRIYAMAADQSARTHIGQARGIDVDSQGRVYMAASNNGVGNVVVRLGADGTVTNIAGGGDLGCGPVVNPDTQVVVNTKLASPQDVELNEDETAVYVADTNNHVIKRVPIGNPGAYTVVEGVCNDNATSTAFVNSLATHEGELYWTSRNHIVSSSGVVGGAQYTAGFRGDGGPVSAALLNQPRIDVSPDGSIFVADSFNHRIRKVTAAPPDTDGDGITDADDNCPDAANADQRDSDEDGIGDACDDTEDPAPPLVDDVTNGRILYETGGAQLYTAHSDGSDPRPAATTDTANASYDARWSPDGRLIAAATYFAGVQVIDPATGTTTVLDDGIAVGEIDWSPDGRWIATDKHVDGRASLWLYSVDGAERIDLLAGHDDLEIYTIDWGPDGRLLYDFRPKEDPAAGGTFMYDPETRESTPIGISGDHFRWSPDGQSLVMDRGSDDCDYPTDCSIVGTTDTDGSGWRRLTLPGASEHDPFWSPSGDRIAYMSWTGPGQVGGVETAFSTIARNGVDATLDDFPWMDAHDWQPVLAGGDDFDSDGLQNSEDGCPALADAEDADVDGDGFGDLCDPDLDNDGFGPRLDNCPEVSNPDQADRDGDGVGDACAPEEHELTVAHAGEASGTVTGEGIDCGTDCAESYPDGTSVTLTATPAGGSQFAGWDGCDAVDEAGRCEVTMTSDREVVATFEPTPKHALTVTRAGDGVGAVTGPGINCWSGAESVCSHSYEPGTRVDLTAAPEGGSRFDFWTGCASVDGTTCTVTMDAAKHVTATFEEIPEHELTVTLAGSGAGNVLGTGINCGTDCDAAHPEGTSLTLVATPDGTSTFEGWTGCDDVQEGDCLVTMDAARTVTATFEPTVAETRTVTVEKSGKGAGTVVATDINCGEDCEGTYPTGTVVRLMAYPAEGSTFKGWANCEYTASNECVVTASTDRIVGAKFAPATSKVKTEITSSTIKSKKRKATFEFTGSSSLGKVTFECRIDDKKFKSCSSPRSYGKLKPGSHTFKVRAVDSSGATDTTPAEEKFVIRR